ncbi:MAG: restriction endonuclease subunit S [Nitrospira sp.]|nr:restriction endonuclease subunit S [Nitrospira sp.]
MRLETFFEKFDLFADAPDAVAKMRELILESAIRGMLVPQDACDEPASEMLSRVASAQTGPSRKQAAQPLVGDDAYLQLPPGWEWTRLGNTGRIFNGDSVSESGKAELAKVEEGLPFIATKDVGYGRAALAYDNGLRVPVGDPRFKVARTNAVLICAEGGSAGRKIGIADRDICFGNKLFANEVHEGVHHRYVFYVYQAPTFYKEFAARMTGIIGGISRGEFLSLPFPLPPLAEQKRIAAKVDELMALCDRLESQQNEGEQQGGALARASLARFAQAPTPANLDWLFHSAFSIPPSNLRKSILNLAVQGKLVPQDPNDEPVEVLLNRNLTERRMLNRTEETEVPSLSIEDALNFDIPNSWRWQRLDDLLVFGPTNGFSPKAVDYETPVRSLTLSATTSGRFKGEHSKFITTEVPDDSNLWLRDGDILVQRGNTIEYVGVAAVFRGESNRFVYPDLIMKLRVSSAFDVDFIHLAMSHEAARDYLRARASGTSGSMPKINQTTLKSLPLPIPPLAEQRRIVAKVDELMALVDTLEAQLAAARITGANLLAAAVAELTNGEDAHAAAEV